MRATVDNLGRLPAICATADIYSPICMAVACSILFLFRPILLELGSAIRIDGASVSNVAVSPSRNVTDMSHF